MTAPRHQAVLLVNTVQTWLLAAGRCARHRGNRRRRCGDLLPEGCLDLPDDTTSRAVSKTLRIEESHPLRLFTIGINTTHGKASAYPPGRVGAGSNRKNLSVQRVGSSRVWERLHI